jgi:hypothetical protein
MSQEERSIIWEVIVSVILSKKCPVLNSFRDRPISLYSSKIVDKKEILRAISLYSSKIVDKKEILHTVSNTGIYCSRDKVGTVYLV